MCRDQSGEKEKGRRQARTDVPRLRTESQCVGHLEGSSPFFVSVISDLILGHLGRYGS